MLRESDGDTARQRNVRLIGDQALIGLANREQRSRTSGLQRETGSAEIQLVRNSGCKEVVPVSHQVGIRSYLVGIGELSDIPGTSAQVRQKVSIHAATR